MGKLAKVPLLGLGVGVETLVVAKAILMEVAMIRIMQVIFFMSLLN